MLVCGVGFARFLTLLRATFVEARESGSDVDAAALEVGRQDAWIACRAFLLRSTDALVLELLLPFPARSGPCSHP